MEAASASASVSKSGQYPLMQRAPIGGGLGFGGEGGGGGVWGPSAGAFGG